jgi:Uma2 family endonuclease
MALAKLKTEDEKLYTIEEYLKIEREAFERSEYISGKIFAMAGESEKHGIVSVNLTSEIHQQLKGKDCQLRAKDTKVASNVLPEKKKLFDERNVFLS